MTLKCLNFCDRWYRKGLKGSGSGHAEIDRLSEAKRPPEDCVLSEGLTDTFTRVTRNALTKKFRCRSPLHAGLIDKLSQILPH